MISNSAKTMLKFIDIGSNLTDSMYQGVYHGSKKHEGDLLNVLNRAWSGGLDKIVITGTSLKESEQAVEIANSDERLFCTVGCHPTNCSEIEASENADSYLQSLKQVAEANIEKVVAVGEIGLDYDRLHFCPKDVQNKYFKAQLQNFASTNLPLFLHCRNAADDFLEILTQHRTCWSSGVVHSFDGTEQQAKDFLNLGLYIGVNGCSLKTKENLDVVKTIPNDRLLIETDSPWCEVRPTHAGFSYVKTKLDSVKKEKWAPDKLVKGRNEPTTIRQILEVLAGVKQEDLETLSQQIYNNTCTLFFNNKN